MRPNEKLYRVRTARRLRQVDLATLTDVAQSTISELENGRRVPTAELLTKLMEHLRVSTPEAIGYSLKSQVATTVVRAAD